MTAVEEKPGPIWTPPEGMGSVAIASWRKFYRDALTNYGVTPLDYRAMYLAQQGRCFICRIAKGVHPDDPSAKGGRRLGIDHNHALGNRREAVRGLLCTGGDKTCNRIIGWLGYEGMRRGVEYMQTAPGQRALQVLDVTLKHGLPQAEQDFHLLNSIGLGAR